MEQPLVVGLPGRRAHSTGLSRPGKTTLSIDYSICRPKISDLNSHFPLGAEMKLGEVLVHRGVITEQQLKKALDAQLIFGAHLGTCLIELGFIEEDTLGTILSEIL